MDRSERPRSNDSRKLAGVDQAKRSKRPKTSREERDKARRALEREILKHADPQLRSAFKKFKTGCTPETLMGILGMELMRLQRSLGPDEPPDYRYNSAVQKILDQMRRALLMNEESAFIPDRVTLTVDKPDGLEDYSDEPEFE